MELIVLLYLVALTYLNGWIIANCPEHFSQISVYLSKSSRNEKAEARHAPETRCADTALRPLLISRVSGVLKIFSYPKFVRYTFWDQVIRWEEDYHLSRLGGTPPYYYWITSDSSNVQSVCTWMRLYTGNDLC
jgi:hypothetical protein